MSFSQEEIDYQDIEEQYHRGEIGNYRCIDISQTLQRQKQWEAKHGRELTIGVLARVILQQRIEEWVQKYNKNTDNIIHYVNNIIEGSFNARAG